MLLVRNIRLPLTCPDPDAEAAAKALAILRVPARRAAHCGVAKLSVDARHGTPVLVYTIAVTLKDEGEESALAGASPCVCYTQPPKFDFTTGKTPLTHRPVVVGLGPAGLFAALLLARRGYRPLVLERGPALDERIRAVEHFEKTGTLDPNANIQFGEGGAGTFSDGKLTTRVGDPLCAFVTGAFLDHGAPADIAWRQKPHVGTDLLRGVIRSIRGEIEALGGEVRFNTALTGLHTRNGALTGIETTAGPVPCEQMILAVGHSARDTFDMLHGLGLPLECKPFSVGFRAEHLQTEIDKSLYHGAAGHPALPKGEYQLSQHVSGGRCVYTFCMCPGGTVCAAASEAGGVVTNGMSLHARDGRNAQIKQEKAYETVAKAVANGDFPNAAISDDYSTLYLDDSLMPTAAKPADAPQAESAEPLTDAEQFRREGMDFLNYLKVCRGKLGTDADEELAAMQKTCASIMGFVHNHPEQLNRVRRFREYYLPTTRKLLDTAQGLGDTDSANAVEIRRDITGILHTLNQAYEKLYDTLLQDVSMDVSTEIDTLEAMLRQDGLTHDFEADFNTRS